jgi:hypothetical protein
MIADTAPAIAQIARNTKLQEQGVVVYRMRRVFDVHAGPMHRHDELTLAIASLNGLTVKVRVLRAITGGKVAGSAAVTQIENQYEHPKPDDVFHRPFDPHYLNEYAYQAIDARTYRFTSTMHDSSHGDGTFWIDNRESVVKYQYTPNALPPYATSGIVTDERAQVLADFWFLTREVYEYRGHYLIFGGGSTTAITYDSFKRYPNVASAISALQTVPI